MERARVPTRPLLHSEEAGRWTPERASCGVRPSLATVPRSKYPTGRPRNRAPGVGRSGFNPNISGCRGVSKSRKSFWDSVSSSMKWDNNSSSQEKNNEMPNFKCLALDDH